MAALASVCSSTFAGQRLQTERRAPRATVSRAVVSPEVGALRKCVARNGLSVWRFVLHRPNPYLTYPIPYLRY